MALEEEVIPNIIREIIRMLQDGFTVKIGDGNSKFWYDTWVLKEKLCSVVPFVAIQDTELRVNDVWQNGRWNLEILYTIIPDVVRDAILLLKPYIVNDIPDVWGWSNSTTGIYSSKDAYDWLLQPLPINNHVNWKWIWKLKVPANIQFFVWQVVHGVVPTRVMLNHRQVCTSNLCPKCTVMPETIEHCLFTCEDAVGIWRRYGLEHLLPSPIDADLFQWCKQVEMSYGNRNEFLFNNNRATVNASVVKISSMVSFCATAFDINYSTNDSRTAPPRLVSWVCPVEGTVCLNVDGSMLGSIQTAGFGGLLRNSHGTFLKGFYGVASQPSVLYAEIMAVLHGLEICWDNGFRNIVCYSDSLQVVSLFTNGVSTYHHYANEIHKVQQLLSRDWNVAINHTLREGNACADLLAKMRVRKFAFGDIR